MDATPEHLLQRLHQRPAAEQRQVLMAHIGAIIQDLRQVELAEPVRAEQKIFELGLPSLMLIELKQRLEQTFAVVLPVTLFFEYTTLEMLTMHLLTEVLQLTPGQPQPGTGQAPPVDDASAIGEELEQLSEEEAEARLLARMAQLQGRLGP